MDHQSFAQEFMRTQKMVQNPIIAFESTFEPTTKSTVDINQISTLMNRMTDGRSAAFVATQAVADGADPKLIKTKCYMPGCSGNGTATYADFKKPVNIKEYTLSGMCQTCQDNFFG